MTKPTNAELTRRIWRKRWGKDAHGYAYRALETVLRSGEVRADMERRGFQPQDIEGVLVELDNITQRLFTRAGRRGRSNG